MSYDKARAAPLECSRLRLRFASPVFSPNYARIWQKRGGVLNSLTRSGSNGSTHAIRLLSKQQLDARNFLTMARSLLLKRNQFGFLLPSIRKTHVCMTNFEAMRDRLTETGVYFFPDALARQGNILKSERVLESGGRELPRQAVPGFVSVAFPQSKLANR